MILSFLPVMFFSQVEKVNFTKKARFYFEDQSSEEMTLYYSKEGVLVDANYQKIFLKSGKIIPVKIDLDKNLSISSRYDVGNDIPKIASFKKTNKTDAIWSNKCTYYDVKFEDNSEADMQMCIVQDPSFDLLKLLPMDDKERVAGYPLIVKKYNYNIFVMKSLENYSNSVQGDFNDMLSILEKNKSEYDGCYDDVAVDSVAAYGDYPEGIEYTSTYKEEGNIGNALAIDYISENSNLWNSIPAYCSDLEGVVLAFSNKKLRKHAKNYAGQICDMYLSFTDNGGVAEKETLDAIRFESDYFIKNYHKLSKKDQKILDEFLEQLD